MSFARYAISALGTGKDRRQFLRNLGMIVQNGGPVMSVNVDVYEQEMYSVNI